MSGIEWTEVTWNPVTGCDRISTGCENCYALTLAKRLKGMGASKYQNDGNPVTSGPGFGVTVHPKTLETPLSWRQSRLVFVNSMSDLFHAKVPISFIKQVFQVMESTPRHTYQLLTKRPTRALKLADKLPWPSNVWLGVSVESSYYTDRIRILQSIPARTRFLSCEPLIDSLGDFNLDGIHWVIAGGESGHHARPMKKEWAIEIRDKCVMAKVPFFFKQWGGRTPKANGRTLDGKVWDEMPALLVG